MVPKSALPEGNACLAWGRPESTSQSAVERVRGELAQARASIEQSDGGGVSLAQLGGLGEGKLTFVLREGADGVNLGLRGAETDRVTGWF